MTLPKYLLHVNSTPTNVSAEIWTKWYTQEHLPDLVNSKTSHNGTLYSEIPTSLDARPSHPRPFLALYQTDFAECLTAAEYNGEGVRRGSDLFKEASGKWDTHENGDFDARNYVLIQEYDPNGIGNEVSEEVVTVEMNPTGDEADFERWYREEHLGLLSKVPGYRRSLRYKIGLETALTKGTPPKYLAIHFVDDVQKRLEEARPALLMRRRGQ